MENISTDLINIIKDYIIFKPKTKEELQEAVNLWCENKEEVLTKYNHISLWDTSLITDMSSLFGYDSECYIYETVEMKRLSLGSKVYFNDDISNWNVSSVTNMSHMFANALSFNQPLDSWDVSSVTDMSYMFYAALSFDQPLNSWDVSSVTNMCGMFNGLDWESLSSIKNIFPINSYSFNQTLNSWDVSSVTTMQGMFDAAVKFNQPID